MVAVEGIYENGSVKLQQEFAAKNPVRVIVTFLENVRPSSNKRLSLTDFSFARSQKALENYQGSFSDTLIEERRSEL